MTNEIDILIRSYFEGTGLKEAEKSIKKFSFAVMGIDDITARIPARFTDINKIMSSLEKKTHRFQMGWLSVMFASWQVYRLMKNLFKDMLDTFKKVGGKMHPLNLAMTRLEASFTYLKYSIMEAMSPLLEKFVLWFADMAIAIAEMDPRTLEAIGIALLIIAGIVGIGYIVSQIALLANGIKGLVIQKNITGLNDIHASLLDLASVGAIAVGIGILWKIKDTPESVKKDFLTALATAGIGGGLAQLILTKLLGVGMAVAGPISATVALTIFVAVMMKEAEKEMIKLEDRLKQIPTNILPSWQAKFINFFEDLRGNIEYMITGKKPEEKKPSAVEEINKQIQEMASLTTPESITAMKSLWDEGVIQNLAKSLSEEGGLIPAFKNLTLQIDTSKASMDLMQDDWDTWKPIDKHIYIYYHHVGKGDAGTGTSTAGTERGSLVQTKTPK